MKRADMHMHSTMSDGSDSPKGLITQLQRAGISIFALTDHDVTAGIPVIRDIIPDDMEYYTGVEFSCTTPKGKCHILGYRFDPDHPLIREAVEDGHRRRMAKFQTRLDYMQNELGVKLTEEDQAYIRSLDTPGRPHLGEILVRKGFASSVGEAIGKYLNFGVADSRIDAEIAIRAIREAGGLVVWAHPFGGEGEKRLTQQQFRDQLETLCSLGIDGLECYYSRYTMEEIDLLLETAEEKKLLISGGSDYHGSRKTVRLGELNTENMPVDADRLTILQALRN